MRCPKCGYISFDHLDTCLKCNKDISGTSELLHGSVYNVAAPAFLKFTAPSEADEVELDEAFIVDEDGFMDEEIRDPDLDILLEEPADEEEGEFEISLGEDEFEKGDREISPAESEEEGTISFNLDDFDDEADLGDEDLDSGKVGKKPPAMGLPDELSDMSDLEPPSVLKDLAEEPVAAAADEDEDEDGDLDLDIDFDLNLGADDLEPAPPAGKESALADLSLSDLDLDEELPPKQAPKKKAAGEKLDLDNLDFDLDLGDLKLDDDEKF